MKRTFLISICLLALAPFAHAQVNSQRVIFTGSATPTSCVPGKVYTTTGLSPAKAWVGTSAGTCTPIDPATAGDVAGPASATDNAVARFDGTGGKTLQNSLMTVDDSGSPNIPTGQTYKINSVSLAKGDVGLGNVDNTSDVNKPVSTAQAAADALKLNLAGGTLTGNLLFSADNTLDIGASGATRPRDFFLGRNAVIGGTLNSLTISTSTGTLNIGNLKTFTLSNTLTLAGTDGSTLNVGTGGTLGTAAFTAASAYEVPLTFSTGLTRSTNTVTVNTSQNIATLSNLTTNGLVTTSGGVGTLGVTVPGTNVLTALGVNVGSAGAVVVNGGALGTPSSGIGTNITGIPAASILAGSFGAGAYVISTSLQAATIELGHAIDTTLSRVSAGVIAVEGVNVLLNGGALGTPSSGVATNLTGTAASLTAGTATNATNVASITKADNVSYFLTFVAANSSSNQAVDVGPATYNPSTSTITATTFVGAVTGHASLDAALTGAAFTGATSFTVSSGIPVTASTSVNNNYAGSFTSTAVTSGQNLGVIIVAGSTSGDYSLRIFDKTTTNGYLQVRGDGHIFMSSITSSSSATSADACFTGSGATQEIVTDSALCIVSASRFKNHINYSGTPGLNFVRQLHPIRYFLNDAPERGEQFGFKAEDVERLDKRFVTYQTDGQIRSVLYINLIAPLTTAIQELSAKVDAQGVTISAQQSQIKTLTYERFENEKTINRHRPIRSHRPRAN